MINQEITTINYTQQMRHASRLVQIKYGARKKKEGNWRYPVQISRCTIDSALDEIQQPEQHSSLVYSYIYIAFFIGIEREGLLKIGPLGQ